MMERTSRVVPMMPRHPLVCILLVAKKEFLAHSRKYVLSARSAKKRLAVALS